MEYEDMFSAVKDGVMAANAEKAQPSRMMPINPFDAFNDEGRPVQVIGVIDDEDHMRFIVIIEDVDSDGENYPIAEHSVFKRPPPVVAVAATCIKT
jgi:hypothetical protein